MGNHLKEIEESLTFDDVLLVPAFSEVLPKEVDISTQLTRTVQLNIPLVSAAMDTVTESRTAISMAQEGGIGIIHRNMPIANQAMEVDKVKKSESGMILNPITMHPEQKIYEAMEIMKKYRISGVPITKDGKLVGILTNRDLRFEKRLDEKISVVMTKDHLITVPVGTTLEESKEILHKNRIEKLLVVDNQNNLRGLITIKDIEKIRKYPNSCKDHLGRLRVGAAIGIGQDREARTEALIKAGVGPGSICTTRVVAGVGIPQLSAILETTELLSKHGIPIIADGGIKFSGDITKALAAGALSVMIGNLFAGTDESPGDIVLYQGRSYKG